MADASCIMSRMDGFKNSALDYATLSEMKRHNSAWRLLQADSAPLVLSFLHEVFILPNVRTISEADLAEKLEDTLRSIRGEGGRVFPRPATDYLKEWAEPEREWVRRFYPMRSDEAHYDMTPASETAVRWVMGLSERAFIGAESRLKLAFDLLRQILEGAETDREARIAELKKRRDEIDDEIERTERGESIPMDDTAIKERFMQFSDTAFALLGDFRTVETNFKKLDGDVRKKIASWDEGKGALLSEILNARDSIEDSDQGRSFLAFSDFLQRRSSQREFRERLSKVLNVPAVANLKPDERTGRLLSSWLDACEHVLRTISQLSSQLRTFLDNRAWLENRRIAELLRSIESNAVKLGSRRPEGVFMELDGDSVEIDMFMERPLYSKPETVRITSEGIVAGSGVSDDELLFDSDWVDTSLLADRISRRVARTGPVSLGDLIGEYPLEKGLDELVAYMGIASEREGTVFDDTETEQVQWLAQDDDGLVRVATLPKIIFTE